MTQASPDFFDDESEYNIVPFVCESSKPKMHNESFKKSRGGHKKRTNEFGSHLQEQAVNETNLVSNNNSIPVIDVSRISSKDDKRSNFIAAEESHRVEEFQQDQEDQDDEQFEDFNQQAEDER